jgi:DNA-binding transcriptional ArsR family regulator
VSRPVDITDPTIAKAYSHPLRVEILGLLDNRVTTPRQIATELGAGLSLTSYHVRQLLAARLIRLVKRRVVRGTIEHYYTATVRPAISADAWAQLPAVVKGRHVGGKIAEIGAQVAAAAGEGGFDRPEMHLMRTSMRLTDEGWKEAAEILARAREEIEALSATSAATSTKSDGQELHATAVMMLFEAEASKSNGAVDKD